MKERLSISFSGGPTSAYMTKMLLDNYSDRYEMDVVFANTGQEHERTLEFIKNCDDEWGFNTTWIEAVTNPEKGKGTRHKVVSFYKCSRDGEPFESFISKEGIPNQSRPRCSHRLKELAMTSYRKSIGWEKALVAIGIRIDETRRVNKNAVDYGIIYPLIDMMPTDKPFIIDWFKQQPFDLQIPERLGNCVWCWKKTLSKHIKLIKECPEIYDFPRRMENQYSHIGTKDGTGYDRHLFFRGNRSVDDLFRIANSQMDLFNEIIQEDATSECGESCEVFPMGRARNEARNKS